MKDKKIKNINIKFEGFDDWGRPVFKDVDTIIRYGSVEVLGYGKTKEEIINFFKENPDQLCYFGATFNCEPHGGMPKNYRLHVIDEVPPMYVITGVDKQGKRFKPIHTNTPQHYNIWRGTIWKQQNGVRTKVMTINN